MSNITKQGNLITNNIYESDAIENNEDLSKYTTTEHVKIRIANEYITCNEIIEV